MKKLVMAAAVLGAFAGAAQAQTSVTLYGIADGSLRFDHTNIGTLKSLGSGASAGSRWGMRGSEDLGGGLKANFILEQGFDIGDNASPQGNIGAGASAGLGGASTAPHTSSGSRIFSRVATVGLAGPFGEVRFGRSYNPLFLVQATADPFAAGAGTFSNLFVSNTIRNDNAVYYDTPRFSGFQLSGVYQMGESTTNNPATQTKNGNNRYGAGATYVNGPLYVGVGYEQIKANTEAFRQRTGDVAATYDFGVVKLHAVYWKTRNDNPAPTAVSLHYSAFALGVTVPFGAWTFLGSYGRGTDKSTSNAGANLGTPKVDYFSLGTQYSLSKRTVLYGVYARMNLKRGPAGNAFQGFGGISDASNSGLYTAANLAGINPYTFWFGMRHSF